MARSQLPPEVERMLAAGGEMGELIGDVDWAATPIGEPEGWPQSLRTAVSICLESSFPMLVWWGPELVMIYNKAYSSLIGVKHPAAMGQRGRDCWPEIWDTIGPMLSAVTAGRGATYSEDQLMRLLRRGFLEECYFTFSFSPIRDETGGIGGVFTAATETTGRIIGARRLAILQSLAQSMMGSTSPEQVFAEALRVLDTARSDVPCAAAYRAGDEGPEPLSVAGDLLADELRPLTRAVETAGDPGPEGALVRLDAPVGGDEIRELVVFPVEAGGVASRLALGVSRHLLLDDEYRSFLRLVAGQVSKALSDALSYQAERARAEALAELDRAKTTFFANVSHEFRTPLTLMLGPTEDALGDDLEPLGPRQRPRAELVRRNSLRLLKLVNTLLDFSRLESGRANIRYQAVDLGRLTAELAGQFRAAVERAGLTFSVDCPPLSAPAFVDRDMWEKAVLNLLSNALKFTLDGSISVALREENDQAVLQVMDTGVGIDREDQTAVFERFHRSAASRSRTFEGSGIGLALVAEVARLHGGSVSVVSEPGKGSMFTLALPLGSDHLPQDRIAEGVEDTGSTSLVREGFLSEALHWVEGESTSLPISSGPATEEPSDAARPRVLVVDDNADMRAYVNAVLGRECDVTGASDGAVALELIREDPPDLVLADVMMPVLDGFGLLAELRSDLRTAGIPVIMLSARAGNEAAVEGLDAGADDYITKPFAARELLARVRSALALESLRRARGHDRELLDALETHRAMLDLAQRLAGVGSWELDLTTGAVTASDELLRQLHMSRDDLASGGLEAVLTKRCHPDDVELVRESLRAGAEGKPIDYEVRLVYPDGEVRTFRTLGVLERDAAGRPARLLGSNQDVTTQHQVEMARAAEAAAREAAAREHRIADTLQHSLLPSDRFVAEQFDIAAYYHAGTEGTQVGGDWYDVIELGVDRVGLVVGDVMGRGVRAAAVMGQLRAAIRAYSRLDLPPADLLELLDGVVRDFGEDQIVTCVYAVYDPADGTLTYANAGHLPPVLVNASGVLERLTRSQAPPLGTGLVYPDEERVTLEQGVTLSLYTDGLVERRDRDIDVGMDALERALVDAADCALEDLPARVAQALEVEAADDDVALLTVRVRQGGHPDDVVACGVIDSPEAVVGARRLAEETLGSWSLPGDLVDDAVLVVSELVTNAITHAKPPIQLRIRRTPTSLIVEVFDGTTFPPRLLRANPEDEGGRGVQLVALLADRWGVRPAHAGKATWCVFRLDGRAAPVAASTFAALGES